MVGGVAIGEAFSPRAKLTTDNKTIQVYVLTPISNKKYPRAARLHMENKRFPSPQAAEKHGPYPGFFANIESKPISVPNHLDVESIFAGRKDLDKRSLSDIRHLQQAGVKTI